MRTHKVRLKFFQDDATGEFGLAPLGCFDGENTTFNAFWNGNGVFHDVFEHWFENEHKYFKGDFALNLAGEMAAMGAMFYYVAILGVHNRKYNNWKCIGDSVCYENYGSLVEYIKHDGIYYGNLLLCNIPKQRPVNGELESWLEHYWDKIKEIPVYSESKEVKNYCRDYKKSVTKRKWLDTYRYGYRLAEKLIPDNRENMEILSEFITFWDTFCKLNNPEYLSNNFNYLDITVKIVNQIASWDAKLISKDIFISDCTVIRASEVCIEELYTFDSYS